MKMKACAYFLAFVVVLAGVARADDDQDLATQCNRAWLASDWPSVVAECQTYAEKQEETAVSYNQQAQNLPAGAPADLTTGALQIAALADLLAGEARARSAVGYWKLKKKSLFSTERQTATTDLGAAITLGADPGVSQKATSLKSFVASELFVIDAPDSDLLSHI